MKNGVAKLLGCVLAGCREWVSKNVPDTYMVTLQHTGEGKLIHPTRKHGLSVALSNAVLNSKFGVDVEYSGPIAESFEEIENGLRITFSHADGLHIRGEYLEDTFIWPTAPSAVKSAPSAFTATF